MKVEATVVTYRKEEQIGVRFSSYDPDFVESVKTIGGARWWKEEKTWRLPLTVDNCHDLRKVFKKDLKVLGPLADWYRAHGAEADAHAALSAAKDAELLRVPEVAPRMFAVLRPDQRAGVSWIAHPY